jgi:hypothetical protein
VHHGYTVPAGQCGREADQYPSEARPGVVLEQHLFHRHRGRSVLRFERERAVLREIGAPYNRAGLIAELDATARIAPRSRTTTP